MPNISSFSPTQASFLFSLWPHFISICVINRKIQKDFTKTFAHVRKARLQ